MHLKPALAVQISARWAVPFFFICSSYFLFRKSKNKTVDRETIRKYIHRILTIYLVWFIFNIPSIIYTRLYGKDLSEILTWLIFIKRSVLSSTFTGSWYLTSSIFSALVIYLLSKKMKTEAILVITFVSYFICLLSSAYAGVLPEKTLKVLSDLCFPLNIFTGCFYFALGKYVSENEEKLISRFSVGKCILLSVVFYMTFVVEICLTKKFSVMGSTDVAFSLGPLAFFLLLSCLQLKIRCKYAAVLRKLSIIVFCSQGNVLWFRSRLYSYGVHSLIKQYIMTFALVGIICIVVLYLQKKQRWKWTEYLA